MRKQFVLLFMLCVALAAQAELVTLKNGTQIRGTIVVQNDEVVIVREASGARYQYPRAEVLSIAEEKETVQEKEEEVKTVGLGHQKKASIALEAGVGASVFPNDGKAGVAYSVDLLVGSHNLADKRIFVGGGVGYHGDWLGGQPKEFNSYSFLPVQAVLRMPLIVQKHAPMFGVSLGYGIALSKQYVGGLYADVLFGYRYEINSKTSLGVCANLSFQQARVTVQETPLETLPKAVYTNQAGRSILRAGLKMSLFF